MPMLCMVTDRRRCKGRRLEDVVDAAVGGGAGMVQLREKDLPAADLHALGLRLRDVVGDRALLFVNDRVDVALACGADGVQLGERGLPIGAARRVAGDRLLIGRSVHSAAGAAAAARAGADLITLGTIFATASHPGEPTGGLALITDAAAACGAPTLGIGGIDAANAGSVIVSGADGVAVISAICGSDDPGRAAADLLGAMRAARAAMPATASAPTPRDCGDTAARR